MTFALTDRQKEANRLLGSACKHVLLRGGSRSGKTFLIMRAIMIRALAHKSRHAVLRYRFNHLKASIILDTLPKMMGLCYPDIATLCRLDKSDWFYELPNGSQIWFGGLDDKERTEKILGQEYATLFLNECSQIPWSSRNIAVTRLAQQTPLRLKGFYDCNPPNKTHWTYQLFIKKVDPDKGTNRPDADNFGSMQLNPGDNRANLSSSYIEELEGLPERLRRRFLEGEFGEVTDGALWTLESLDIGRLVGELPEMQRVIVAIDPSGCSGKEDERSDEVGIVVCGLGVDGKAYVLEDLSGRHGPEQWGNIAASAYERWDASSVVAEINFGGAMVKEVIRAAASKRRQSIVFREVRASRGKLARAEPIAVLFDQNKVSMAGRFPKLEDQLCSMTPAGYTGSKSPDRADAMVWGMTALFPAVTSQRKAFSLPIDSIIPPQQIGPQAWMLR